MAARWTTTLEPEETDLQQARESMALHLEALDDIKDLVVTAERRTAALGRAFDALTEAALEAPEIVRMLEKKAIGANSFSYIAIALPQLLSLLMDVDAALTEDPDYAIREARYRPVRFLEVGCGPGRNVHLVRTCGVLNWAEARGFDIVEAYVEAGQRAFNLGDALFVGDALKHDYGQADVIFSYRPFSDDKTEKKFEKRLADGMRVGAYLMAPLSDIFEGDRRLVAVGESGQVWKKVA